ncbi:MAG: hypothetical protein QXI38_03400 [Conexivisphaerales archaeon]
MDTTAKVYVIPKKNSTLNGFQKCKDTMKDFVRITVSYLEQYHKRSNSESGFSEDKKMLAVLSHRQRREDRLCDVLHRALAQPGIVEFCPTAGVRGFMF